MEASAGPPKVIAKGRPQCDWLLPVRARWVLLAAASTMLIGCHSMGGSSRGSAAWHEPLDYLSGLRADYFRLESKRIGRGFHICVRLPEGYGQEKDKRYPTVYVLDGDVLFPILAPSQLLLNYDAGIPEAIVVGISYGSFDPPINKRHFDFSGPAADARADEGGGTGLRSISSRGADSHDRAAVSRRSKSTSPVRAKPRGLYGALVGFHGPGSFLGAHCQQSGFLSG
jgi:hypothetical protein